MPTYIRSKINTDLPVEITLNSEGSETILNQDGTFRLPGISTNGVGSLRFVDNRVEVKIANNGDPADWKRITVVTDLSAVATSGLFSDLVSIPTTISGYGITDAYTKTQVDTGISTAINNLIDSAPDLLNTLNELAQALNDDANFAGTITASLNGKLSLNGGTMTGALILNDDPTNLLGAATKQYVDNATSSVIDTVNTDDLAEGSGNLYYTNARARAAISVAGSGSYDSTSGIITVTGGVTSVNNKTGAVTISTKDVGEDTNLYYTDARARAAISVTGGASYDSRTGVITVTGYTTPTTTAITEGSNLYYTDARARAAISVAGSGSYDGATGVITVTGGVTSVNNKNGAVSLSTTDISEGTNLYYTDAKVNSAFDTRFATKSTTNLTEGTNQYFTPARAREAISASGSLSYSNGVVSYTTPNSDGISEGTTNRYFTQGRARSSVSAGTGISYDSATGIIAVNTGIIATKNDLTTSNVTEGTNLYYTINRTKTDGFATKAYVDGQISQVSLNVINTIDTVGSFITQTAATTATLVTLIDSMSLPQFAQSDWNQTDNTKLDYIRNKPDLSHAGRGTISVTGDLSYNSSTGVISFTQNKSWSALTGKPTTISGYGITDAYTKTQVDSAITSAISSKDNTDEITEGLTNKYYTDARARAAVSAGAGLSYNSSTGIMSLSSSATIDGGDVNFNGSVAGSGSDTSGNSSNYTLPVATTLTLGGVKVDGSTITITEDGTITASASHFNGNYDSLNNKPQLALVATSGNFDDLTSKPSFATVATSGSYNDLTHTPSIPAAQVQSDWNAVTGLGYILNKPTFATVATTGNYDDLNGIPPLYELPQATTTRSGGVKVDGTSITATNGVISVDSSYALKTYVDNQVAGIVNSSPGALNTLNELAAALGNDANFAATISNNIGTKLSTAAFPETFDTRLATKSTDNLTEGTNLYYTPTRVGNYLTANGYTTKAYVDGQVATVISTIEKGSIATVITNTNSLITSTNAIVNALGNLTWDNINNKPTIPAAQVQSDWNQTNNTSLDYIKNKPTIPAAQVQSDWNSVSGLGRILNKPTLATSATTDTTNAANITSGTLPSARLSGSYTGITAVGTLTAGSIPSSLITGLSSSATTDTSNASNISSGTLANARTTATALNTASAIVARDASGNFTAGTITANLTGNVTGSSGSTTGNAATATKLQTARTINGVSFDGSANISFSTSAVSEGTNKYYTDARARTAHSFVAGSGAYNSSTGEITIPTNTNQLTNGAGYITGYTETDTLSTVTARGASTGTAISITNSTASTSKTTGALIVTGGAGIGGALYVGGAITATGDVTAYYSSDRNLKTNIMPINNAVEKVKAIQGVTYNWNEKAVELDKNKNTETKEAGVIAQEVQAVLPEVVKTRDNGFMAVDYEKLTALLIEAIKDQQVQIDELKQDIERLKNG